MNMRRIMTVLILVLSLGTVYAADGDVVLVVYDGRTEINRHAIEFIEDYFRANDAGFRIRAVSAGEAGNLSPREYRAAIVLNTGRQNGISPDLAGLRVVTVNLRPRREGTDIETQGVDAVTAATRWKDRSLFGGTNEIYAMHENWAQFVLSVINGQAQEN